MPAPWTQQEIHQMVAHGTMLERRRQRLERLQEAFLSWDVPPLTTLRLLERCIEATEVDIARVAEVLD